MIRTSQLQPTKGLLNPIRISINDIVRRYNVHETNEKYRKNIGLRLWSTTSINGKTLKILPDV
jgi:hypothetical protein